MNKLIAAAAAGAIIALSAPMATATNTHSTSKSYSYYKVYTVYVTYSRTRHYGHKHHGGATRSDRDAVLAAMKARIKSAHQNAKVLRRLIRNGDLSNDELRQARHELRAEYVRLRQLRSYARVIYRVPAHRLARIVEYFDLPVSLTRRHHRHRHGRHRYGGRYS